MIYNPFDMPFPPDKQEGLQQKLIDGQFSIPHKLDYLASEFPKLTWEMAQYLYEQSVQEVLHEAKVDNLFEGDLSFGRGYQKVRKRFIEKLEQKWPKGAFDF